uniref:DEAD/DEAH box helicase n=1 Tax=Strongyloides venezuelensis TaxID=75913 RepID=A0A0K0G3W1_STRVS
MEFKSIDVEEFDGFIPRSGIKNPLDPLDASLAAFMPKEGNNVQKLSSSERKRLQKQQKKEQSAANKK